MSNGSDVMALRHTHTHTHTLIHYLPALSLRSVAPMSGGSARIHSVLPAIGVTFGPGAVIEIGVKLRTINVVNARRMMVTAAMAAAAATSHSCHRIM